MIGFRLPPVSEQDLAEAIRVYDSVEIEVRKRLPAIQLSAIVERTGALPAGHTIVSLAPAWDAILKVVRTHPDQIYSLTSEQWEEIVAASYDRAGFDEVILTPRSGDFGRDVIAIKRGFYSIRIIDQVKAFRPGHVVTANDVRALLGVLQADQQATKGVVTTTSTFAPKVASDPFIAPFVPFRLELVDKNELFTRLSSLGSQK